LIFFSIFGDKKLTNIYIPIFFFFFFFFKTSTGTLSKQTTMLFVLVKLLTSALK